jgi:hypothetical protein
VEEADVDLRRATRPAAGTGRDGIPAWTGAAWVKPGAVGRRALAAVQRSILRSLLAEEGP